MKKIDPMWLWGGAAALLALFFLTRKGGLGSLLGSGTVTNPLVDVTPGSRPLTMSTVGSQTTTGGTVTAEDVRASAVGTQLGKCLKYVTGPLDGRMTVVMCPPGVTPGTILPAG